MVLPLGPHDGAQDLVKLTKTKDGAAAREPDPGALRAAAARAGARIVRTSAFGIASDRAEFVRYDASIRIRRLG